ncbi:MAG: adenosylcobalamin-dependent ribonucleoside-diphosphate reductase [Bacteroidales bacterium]
MIKEVQNKNKEKKLETSYTINEAVSAATEYFDGDEMAAKVWVSKYALKDSDGNLFEKTPDDMHRRLSKEIARIESRYNKPVEEKRIYELLKNFKYIIPQGGPMTGIGNNYQIASLSNCFVIGNNGQSDSYGGILKTDQEQVQLMKRRGGVGHDLSHIRPKGSPVKNSALTSTGIVPFMERFSNSTREVAQDGRRGALMLSVSIKHPDSELFIDAKTDTNKVTGANVSVKIDNDFMNAVASGQKYQQQYPTKSDKPTTVKEINAKELWDKIVHNAWQSAEPGILFWDTIINESVPDCYADLGYETVSTNPCGEIPLCPYDSCRLLALNLYSYVKNPFTKNAKFDFDLFKEHVPYAQRIMDDIIDLELEKIDAIIQKIDADPETEEVKNTERLLWINIQRKAKEGRRTGIGITAEGDMLAALGLRYGSEEANNFVEQVHKTLAIEAYRASANLAKERGAFMIHDNEREKNNPFLNRLKDADPQLKDDLEKYGRRNIALLTVAPTGTTSLMSQTTSGIEPAFELWYTRRRKVNPNDKDVNISFTDEVGDSWEEFDVFHHHFKTWMQTSGYDISKQYSIDEVKALIEKSPYLNATSKDVDWMSKVHMQGRIQKWVDHSISVTINLPSDASEELVGKLYFEAWKSGCKGVTVYRDGSRTGVLVSKQEEKEEKQHSLTRPESLDADVVRFQNNKEKWIAFIGVLNGRPYEIFTGLYDEDEGLYVPRTITKGLITKRHTKDGQKIYDFKFVNCRGLAGSITGLSYKFDKEFWNYAKLISGMLRYGMPVEDTIKLISGMHFNDENINSWKNGVARALKTYIKDGTKAEGVCEECNSSDLHFQEGCITCKSCGHSKCG